uniref:NADAR domain-containing protein n=1 Tax=Rhabditophanes sp. KR3021 TaxID=114890 RepID=A0AC35U9N4_9BILA
MDDRDEMKQKFSAMVNRPIKLSGATYDADDKPIPIIGSYAVISLSGVFKPLSIYYPILFDIKKVEYRSVEHYAYQRLFEALKVVDEAIEKVRNVENPLDLPELAEIIYKENKINQELVDNKVFKMDKWRQTAMRYKISRHDYLEQLLLATGDAILLEPRGNDKKWSCLVPETVIQSELVKEETTPSTLIDWMTLRKPKRPDHLKEMGGNRAGLVMMELREKAKEDHESRIPIIRPFDIEKVKYYVSNHLICFTAESVFHPFYPITVKTTENGVIKEYSSAVHLFASKAIKALDISLTNGDSIMSSDNSLECWVILHKVIDALEMSLEKSMNWYMNDRHELLKEAMQTTITQSMHIQRLLLETNEALLVFCSRFNTIDSELTIGIRERDLRPWLTMQHLSTKDLISICGAPLAFRPPYVGGNRLGFILMEIRRDIMLKGLYPKKMPEFKVAMETLLGSDSPTENFISNVPFDVINSENFTAIWPNPFLIEAKETRNYIMWQQGTTVKPVPTIISTDDIFLTDILKKLEAISFDLHISRDILSKLTIEQFRSTAMNLTNFFLSCPGKMKKGEADILRLLKEIGEKDRFVKNVVGNWTSKMTIDVYAGTFEENEFNTLRRSAQMPRQAHPQDHRTPQAPNMMGRGNYKNDGGNMMGHNCGNFQANQFANNGQGNAIRGGATNRRNNQGTNINNFGRNGGRHNNSNTRGVPMRNQLFGNNHPNNQFGGNQNRNRNQNPQQPQQINRPKHETPSIPKKAKKIVKAEELSDGEIVSDED